MKKMIIGALVFMAMAFTSTQVNAQKRHNPNSYNTQQQRINRGVVHGKLARSEARDLRSQQARIVQMKKMAMADGYISPKERIMIAKAERRANRNVYYQKHDRRSRF